MKTDLSCFSLCITIAPTLFVSNQNLGSESFSCVEDVSGDANINAIPTDDMNVILKSRILLDSLGRVGHNIFYYLIFVPSRSAFSTCDQVI
jgi:hypothetical protein